MAIFIDTTVLIEIAEKNDSATENFVRNRTPAQLPLYAIRELLAGHLQILNSVHSRLVQTKNISEALVALASLSSFVGRKKGAAIEVFANGLNVAFSANPDGSRSSLREEMAAELAVKIQKVWRQARKEGLFSHLQHLGCFVAGEFSFLEDGRLQPPAEKFNCQKSARCAAAAYMSENPSALVKMLESIHPRNLGDEANKNENVQRRKALRDLIDNGPVAFHKGRCRALGDAYFAAMAPHGCAIATTNESDFRPLCESLGKQIVNPKKDI